MKKLTREALEELKNRSYDLSTFIERVKPVVEDVKKRGDAAVKEYTEKLDKVKLEELEVPPSELDDALARIPRDLLEALEEAAWNIRKFHEAHKPRDAVLVLPHGAYMLLWKPLHRIGCYVPGGRNPYPSTALMTVIPADVAGVDEIIVASPPTSTGKPHDLVLAAVRLASRRARVYAMGGAQAVAAMAYGTESVPKVDKIVGPGGPYVQAAKLLVSKDVGIDMVAGPSEVVILADETADPREVAYALLAQAEHGPLSTALLITTSEKLASSVEGVLRGERREGLGKIEVLVAESLDEAVEAVEEIAPEHLELYLEDPWKALSKVRCAGSVTVKAPAASTDYILGPNHVLPTTRAARHRGPLTVYDYMKPLAVAMPSKEAAQLLLKAKLIAEAEGFTLHARSLEEATRKWA